MRFDQVRSGEGERIVRKVRVRRAEGVREERMRMRLDLPAVTRSADDLGQVRGVKSASAVNCVEVTMKVALDSEAN